MIQVELSPPNINIIIITYIFTVLCVFHFRHTPDYNIARPRDEIQTASAVTALKQSVYTVRFCSLRAASILPHEIELKAAYICKLMRAWQQGHCTDAGLNTVSRNIF